MFKLVVLSALFALAAAKPGFLHAPLVAAPVTKIVQPAPLLVSEPAHVGSVISSVPTGVSAHSSSVVHSTGAVVTPVVTPIQKTIIAPAPIVKTIAPAPIYTAPIVKTYAAAPAYSAYSAYSAYPSYPAYSAYSAYAHAPVAHAPLAYSAPYW